MVENKIKVVVYVNICLNGIRRYIGLRPQTEDKKYKVFPFEQIKKEVSGRLFQNRHFLNLRCLERRV